MGDRPILHGRGLPTVQLLPVSNLPHELMYPRDLRAQECLSSMRITSIRVKNFRSLVDLEIPLSRTTVFIGENNSGKSSVLDCLSLALGRRWGRRGTGFSDYDLTIPHEPHQDAVSVAGATNAQAEPSEENPQLALLEGPGADEPLETSIELLFAEAQVGEWPEEITTGLFGLIQTDPNSGLNSICLRVTYKFNAIDRAYEPGWAFIDVNGDPIGSSEAKRAANTRPFFKYAPVFFLSALRDSSEEFSSRSQFWGRLLKAVEISPSERRALDEAIEELNSRLLAGCVD